MLLGPFQSSEPWSKTRIRHDMILAFMIAAPFFIVPALLPAIITARVTSWLIVPLLAPIGAIGPLAIGVAVRALSRDRIARAYVWEGRCGACAFDLAGLEAAEDGCTVCPECGAAWVVRPATQPATHDAAPR